MMKNLPLIGFTLFFLTAGFVSPAQDTTQVFKWDVASKKISDKVYELVFTTQGNAPWDLYAPDQDLSGVASASLTLSDSSFHIVGPFQQTGTAKEQPSKIFTGINEKLYAGPTTWTQQIKIDGVVPGSIQGNLVYNYGKAEEFYQGEFPFTVKLEGGVTSQSRIKIASIDVKNPVSNCGDDDAGNKSLWTLFFIGLGAGLLALLFPCVFPLIPLTVSFFTKRAQSKKQGITNAILYGGSIFLIYTLIKLSFAHLVLVNPGSK